MCFIFFKCMFCVVPKHLLVQTLIDVLLICAWPIKKGENIHKRWIWWTCALLFIKRVGYLSFVLWYQKWHKNSKCLQTLRYITFHVTWMKMRESPNGREFFSSCHRCRRNRRQISDLVDIHLAIYVVLVFNMVYFCPL